MNKNLKRRPVSRELYDNYAGALLSACYSLTHDSAKAEQALINTFTNFNTENSGASQALVFGRLYKQARKECVSIMDSDPGYRYSLLPPLERVVAEMVCVRKYSTTAAAGLLKRGPEEIEAILKSIRNNLR